MRNDYCHVTLVLDNSGSMSDCWNETIKSVKSFLEQQRKLPGKMTFSLYTFNSRVQNVLDFVDIQSNQTYYDNTPKDTILDGIWPSGWTAMYDAAAYSMMNVGDKLREMNESDRPTKVLFVFLTDGGENSSKKSTQQQVKDMMTHQKEKYSWDFVFLGSDFDVSKDATYLGGQSFNYSKSNTWNILSKGLTGSVAAYRSADVGTSYNVADIGVNS